MPNKQSEPKACCVRLTVFVGNWGPACHWVVCYCYFALHISNLSRNKDFVYKSAFDKTASKTLE